MPHFPSLSPTVKTDADLFNRKSTKPKSGWFLQNMTDFKRFPFNNFTYCLTLFSKFFSSFPHGTCSLSVSRQYLALDGIYHPFGVAFPNNSTRRECITTARPIAKTGLSPSPMLFSKRLMRRCQHGKHFSNLQLGRQNRQILNLSFSLFTRSY